MPKTPKNFYIFRHGECPLNVSGRIQGQTFDGELTEKGRAQARRAGRKLQNKNIEIIVSSPMKRARQTAAIVASYVKAPIVFDDRLKEVNMGIVEGMHISEVEKKIQRHLPQVARLQTGRHHNPFRKRRNQSRSPAADTGSFKPLCRRNRLYLHRRLRSRHYHFANAAQPRNQKIRHS